MNEYNTDPRGTELGWDDQITQESAIPLLKPGVYPFTVAKLERKRFNGSAKMSPCNMAELTLSVAGTTVTAKLFLNSKVEWKLSQFFTCIGQKKPGEPLRPNWNAVIGATGRCKIEERDWVGKDGSDRYSNEVAEFLPPAVGAPVGGAPVGGAPAPAQPAPAAQTQTTLFTQAPSPWSRGF